MLFNGMLSAHIGQAAQVTHLDPMSSRWSCDTLQAGYSEVMGESAEEAELLKEIQDSFAPLARITMQDLRSGLSEDELAQLSAQPPDQLDKSTLS